MSNIEWIEPGLEKLVFTTLISTAGKAVGIHPADMQNAIEKLTYPGLGIVRFGIIKLDYEERRATQENLPSFEDILEKLAWIMAAPEESLPPDDFQSRWNGAIREYEQLGQ